MTTTKKFTTYQPTESVDFEINDQHFDCVPMLPGTKLLAFMSKTDKDRPHEMAQAVLDLLHDAVVADQRERFHTYVDDPANAVSMDVLSELAGYVADKLSGVDPTQRQDVRSFAG